ncbi:MAG TPA: hypothetical protein VLC98_06080 [Phnomibacter sp.]|nr:hypothetical protein [Phnomibacter sp.]
MFRNKIFLLIACMGAASMAMAQTTYVPLWAKESWMLDRLEIKAVTDNGLNLSTVKPYMRKAYVAIADSFRQQMLDGKNTVNLSKVDAYNLDRFEANNSEYSRFDTSSMPQWKSKHDFLGFMWPTKGNMIEVNVKDFYLSLNPAINQQQTIETDYDNSRVYVNSKGITARGLIAQKIGFHFFLTDNQEQGPLQFRDYVDSNLAVPGTGYWKKFKDSVGVDYFDARGSVSWNVSQYVNMQFGYDQQFIGNGYRSLFTGNFAPPNLFLKFNTRFWKLNYTNIFSELYPTGKQPGDAELDKKYMAVHHLSINVLPWLNVGAFESMIFGEVNSFKLHYLQPIIFLNTLFSKDGSNNNANIGFDFKANAAKHFQVYGQYLLDNLDGNDGKTGKDWWGNKHAYQLGGKYVDVFGIKNLDLQAEYNQLRPFTYSGSTTNNAYNNYRQPLAHPMGGNLRELIGIVRYQPLPKLYFFGRINYWEQGLDSAGYNFGANVNNINTSVANGGDRLRESGYPMLAGIESKGLNGSITASYELKENLFVDLGGMYRVFDKTDSKRINTSTLTIGFRWNMFRRDYDY